MYSRMASATRDNPELWEQVKKDIQGDMQWNARIAQRAVLEYKKRGGGYIGKKPSGGLTKWTKQDWKYSPEGGTRYLPAKLWDALSPSQRRLLDATKARASARGDRIAEYPKQLLPIIRRFTE